MMTFHVGEKVVYPNQGVGTIENISTRNFGAQFEKFYLLRFVYSTTTVMVPFSNVHQVGLRRVTSVSEIGRILAFLSRGECHCTSDWKDRFKENSDKMQAGGIQGAAEVLKSLLILQKQKPLSFREKKMLSRARYMLVSELSIVRRTSEAEAGDVLVKALAKAALSLPSGL
jgi:CarD family transcriptional regulator